MGKKTEKLFVVGIDAMDPRLTRKYVDMGLMPNTKKILDRGSARQDLVLLGAMPTVTPPQWTTLATGAYPATHEITAFFAQGSDLDLVDMNFDSRACKAEQLWNVTAEAGMKTLVWHWPGSAWPPSSDSPNLHVVDGSSPGNVNMSTAQFTNEFVLEANEKANYTGFVDHDPGSGRVPCMITAEENEDDEELTGLMNLYEDGEGRGFPLYVIDPLVDGQGGYIDTPVEMQLSALKDVGEGWAKAPKDAKEFTILFGKGLIRRPALLLKNDEGVYGKVAIYKNKKAEKPIATVDNGEYVRDFLDEEIKNDNRIPCTRDLRVLEIEPDGSFLRMWFSPAIDISIKEMWHPESLYEEVTEVVGYTPPTSSLGQNKQLIMDCMHECWEHAMDWQSGALNYLIENKGYDVIFSHFHAPDLQEHMFIRNMEKGSEKQGMVPEDYEEIMQAVYTQIDRYLGKFIHLLDKNFTLMVVSDHAQVCPKWGIRGLGDTGLNVGIMEELGYTVMKKDENGNTLPQVDWSKTKAVANREMQIYLNLKGRTDHGIVDLEDQYELEEDIISDLYSYRDKESGKRIIAFALRRKDAALVGLDTPYPQGGDIVYCMAEGYEHDHDDSLSTSWGECDTSVSPIFIAAGPGIKENHITERRIRQVDVAPTIATLLDVRMPNDCEGAPIYQILA